MADLGEQIGEAVQAVARPATLVAGVQTSIARAIREMTMWRMSMLTATWLSAYGGLPEPPKMIRRIMQREEAQYALLWALLYQGTADGDWAKAAVATGGIYLLIKGLDAVEEKRDA